MDIHSKVKCRWLLVLGLLFLLSASTPLAAQLGWQLEWTPTKLIHQRTPALEIGLSTVWNEYNTLSLYGGFPVGVSSTADVNYITDQQYDKWRLQYTRLFPFASSKRQASGWLLGGELGWLNERTKRNANVFTDEDSGLRFAHEGYTRRRTHVKMLMVAGMQTRIAPRFYLQGSTHFGIVAQTRRTNFNELRELSESSSCGLCELAAGFAILSPLTTSDYRRTSQDRHVEGMIHINFQLNFSYRFLEPRARRVLHR